MRLIIILLCAIINSNIIGQEKYYKRYSDNNEIFKIHSTLQVTPGVKIADIAYSIMDKHKKDFDIIGENKMVLTTIDTSTFGYHCLFQQFFNGIIVENSNMVVSISANKNDYYIYSSYKKLVLQFRKPDISNVYAKAKASMLLKNNYSAELSHDAKLVYKTFTTDTALLCTVNLCIGEENVNSITYIDAHTVKVKESFENSFHYVEESGKVYSPEPVTTAQNAYLDPLELQTDYPKTKILTNLNEPINGVYSLRGKYAYVDDIKYPYFGIVQKPDKTFNYSRYNVEFLEVNSYYHLNEVMAYVVEKLGFTTMRWNKMNYVYTHNDPPPEIVRDSYIRFDPHFSNAINHSERNSYYYPFKEREYIVYGYNFDQGISLAEDQTIVVHGLGHAFHDAILLG